MHLLILTHWQQQFNAPLISVREGTFIRGGSGEYKVVFTWLDRSIGMALLKDALGHIPWARKQNAAAPTTAHRKCDTSKAWHIRTVKRRDCDTHVKTVTRPNCDTSVPITMHHQKQTDADKAMIRFVCTFWIQRLLYISIYIIYIHTQNRHKTKKCGFFSSSSNWTINPLFKKKKKRCKSEIW